MRDGRALARAAGAEAEGGRPVELDVWSDIACPFCHVAHVRIARAAAGLGRPAAVRNRAFELQPGLPPEGIDPAAFYADRFGGTAGAAAAFAHMRAFAADDDVTFDFAGMRAPNTRMAQRAIALVEEARGTDAAARLRSALFRAHFEEGRDVADPAVVVALAEDADADRIALSDALAAGGGESRVAADQAEAVRLGVTSVPFASANGLAVSGAQPAEVFAELIRRAGA